MRIFLNIVILGLISFLMSCGDHPLSDRENDTLLGSWEETFSWSPPAVFTDRFNPPDTVMAALPTQKTARLSLDENVFTLKIWPPHHIGYFVKDSLVMTGLSSDTLYTGTYAVSGDTLFLKAEGDANPSGFIFEAGEDRLTFSVVKPDIPDLNVDVQGSFLWGYSFLKTTGTFKRK